MRSIALQTLIVTSKNIMISKIIVISIFYIIIYPKSIFADALIIDDVEIGDVETIIWTNKALSITTSNNIGERINKYEEIISKLEMMKSNLQKSNSNLYKYFWWSVSIVFVLISISIFIFVYNNFYKKHEYSEDELSLYKKNPVKIKMYERFCFYSRVSKYSQKFILYACVYIFVFIALLLYNLVAHEYNNLSMLIDDRFWRLAGIGGIPVVSIFILFKWAEDNLIKVLAMINDQ